MTNDNHDGSQPPLIAGECTNAEKPTPGSSPKRRKRRRGRRGKRVGFTPKETGNFSSQSGPSQAVLSNPVVSVSGVSKLGVSNADDGASSGALSPCEAGSVGPGQPSCAARSPSVRPVSDKSITGLTTPVRQPDKRQPHARRGDISSDARQTYAALDLGTNNCRLLIAVPQGASFRVVDAFSRIVRLGEGVSGSGRLSKEAMDRAVEALKICAAKLKGRDGIRSRLIATEACRIAENGDEFLARVREEAGLNLEIVNRETEARLAVAGCASLVDRRAEGVILFDIGGGSSELVWLDLRDRKKTGRAITRRVRTWTSLPVGVVNISERHGGVDVTPESFEGMIGEVTGLLEAFPEAEALSAMVARGEVHMLGTSGTVTTLAGVHLGLEYYDRRRVDGIWMSAADVSLMTDKLLAMSFEERSRNACIGRERADLVLAGCAILEALRRKWPCERLRVADRGLREGILYEMMNEDGALRGNRPPRRWRKPSGPDGGSASNTAGTSPASRHDGNQPGDR